MTSTVKAVLLGALLATASIVPLQAFADDDDPVKNLELKLEGECDSANSHLFVINKHSSKTIIATLRWNLAGSKRIITDKFQVVAAARVEVGCAAQADIVGAVFAPAG